MRRNVSLDEISDGNLYSSEDLVEVSCNGCKGGANCCHGMGKSIVLDPYDIYRLTTNLNMKFEELLADKLELNLVDGIILPNLKMAGSLESCAFLNESGKCSIHGCRPGICRLFPLGRYYENQEFHYFLQKNECYNGSRTMMKVSRWIDIPELDQYEQFVTEWHYFLNDVEAILKSSQDDKLIKNLTMYLLQLFYIKAYDVSKDFYSQFAQRLEQAKSIISE